jgi:hypothetical protein
LTQSTSLVAIGEARLLLLTLQQAAEMRRVSTLRLAKCVWTSVWL